MRARVPMQGPDALRALVDATIEKLALHETLGGLEEPMRYALTGGGKRIRPVVCLATAEAAGGDVDIALPAAVALELVHTFSLVHDDLPSLDDDDERRGRASTHVAFPEGVAVLAGDALLADALRLALSYPGPEPARELVDATLGMIGGQFLDLAEEADLDRLHRLKTARLFVAAVGLGLWAAEAPPEAQPPWRAFGEELGLLFQVVDDVLDGDGYAESLGAERAQELVTETATRARARLADIPADTAALEEIVDELERASRAV